MASEILCVRCKSNVNYCLKYFIKRCKHKDTHWSVKLKQKTPKHKALQTFDNLYKEFYGSKWPSIRLALLSPSKYCAVVNNFGPTDETVCKLKELGAVEIRDLFDAESELSLYNEANRGRISGSNFHKSSSEIHDIKSKCIGKYTESTVNEGHEGKPFLEAEKNETLLSQASLRSKLDSPSIEYDRIVKPHISGNPVSATTLHEFVPATELKGMEDWVLESEQYKYYQGDQEVPVIRKKEYQLTYPEHWKIMSFIRGNVSRFPSPRRGTLGVYDYYLLDGASILPVLALNISLGDRILDMCAAPGGKSLLALQTLYPGMLISSTYCINLIQMIDVSNFPSDLVVSNDVQLSRTKRINGVLNDYVFSLESWRKKVMVTKKDGRNIDDVNTFNKILVDAPCTTDRHSVLEGDNNIFSPHRIKERLQLPNLQSDLLSNALKIVCPGGTVVYSTCSLSPIQNVGVVHMALKKMWEETDFEFEVRDLSPALQSTKHLFNFGSTNQLQYGHIVLPIVPNNFGPTYFCKIVKKK
ncbi:hypothetical protein J437_LFUL005491 [Ladona fulva]|uniref:NOL1/NOP2/Sun domain family member 4 n=1 Tax=Ladona fulva TaxID=123851 RepID=A0A8K0K2X6_LADFU|nr:hypothetical protein J437_LFUL005491 [Ladona fulva]